MPIYYSNEKKVHYFRCTKCGYETSDKEDVWIATYNICTNCYNYTMKAKKKGKISNYNDYNNKNSISISHKNYSYDFFYNNTKEIRFDDNTNMITVILDTGKIIKEIKRKIGMECDILNTNIPKDIFIKLDKK